MKKQIYLTIILSFVFLLILNWCNKNEAEKDNKAEEKEVKTSYTDNKKSENNDVSYSNTKAAGNIEKKNDNNNNSYSNTKAESEQKSYSNNNSYSNTTSSKDKELDDIVYKLTSMEKSFFGVSKSDNEFKTLIRSLASHYNVTYSYVADLAAKGVEMSNKKIKFSDMLIAMNTAKDTFAKITDLATASYMILVKSN